MGFFTAGLLAAFNVLMCSMNLQEGLGFLVSHPKLIYWCTLVSLGLLFCETHFGKL